VHIKLKTLKNGWWAGRLRQCAERLDSFQMVASVKL